MIGSYISFTVAEMYYSSEKKLSWEESVNYNTIYQFQAGINLYTLKSVFKLYW